MHYKNMNLVLPTKNDMDRKSPLKLRPNVGAQPLNPANLTRNYSNTLPGGQRPEDLGQSAQLPTQNMPPNANPLQGSLNFAPGQPSPLVTKHNPLNQSGPVYSQGNANSFGLATGNQNSTGNLQLQSGLNLKPTSASDFFNGQPKESNLSALSRGNTNNDFSRFQSNTHQSNVIGRPSEVNETFSCHSKRSTNSRSNVLRAISVNNEDHLSNLAGKEETIKNQNILVASNFLQTMESSKRNVRRNMTENFKARIQEIWTSYLAEQARTIPPTLDVNGLNGDVDMIKKAFLESLLSKTDLYIEELKHAALTDVFLRLDHMFPTSG